MSRIIFLNGCGSAGKTSIAKALQELSETPLLRLGIDSFIDMMPEQFIAFGKKSAQGYFSFIPGENDRGALMKAENGLLGDKFFVQSVPKIIASFADTENDLVLDEVLLGDAMLKEYVRNLSHHKVYFVKVDCDLKIMQERERNRSNRVIGLSNDQLDKVHAGIREYDFEVNTNNTPSIDLAQSILNFVNTTRDPQAMFRLKTRFGV